MRGKKGTEALKLLTFTVQKIVLNNLFWKHMVLYNFYRMKEIKDQGAREIV